MSRSSEILTTHQVAEKLGVNPVTVARWVKAGKLPAFKTAGGHRRIRKDDLDQFLTECGFFPEKSSNSESSAVTTMPISPGTRVLIVDDEPDIVTLIQRTIQDLDKGFIIEIANDGFEAGWLLYKFRPQIVFLDLKMDGLDGFEVCQRIKGDPSTASSYVIAVTGYATQDNREKILSVGAAECLAKPIGPTDIREALYRASSKIQAN